jgi:hypothetical protein
MSVCQCETFFEPVCEIKLAGIDYRRQYRKGTATYNRTKVNVPQQLLLQ